MAKIASYYIFTKKMLLWVLNFVFFNDTVSVSKTELDFTLILCDIVCDQCNENAS